MRNYNCRAHRADMSILRYLGFPGCLTAMTPSSVSNSWHSLGFGHAATA
jgi:hypothetical protein